MDAAGSETDDRPLYSVRRKRLLRAFVIIAVAAMMLPILASLVTVTAGTAAAACARAVAYSVPDATSSTARFELFGEGGLGWQCYAVGGFGGDRFVGSLGLIPGEVNLPGGTNT